jgi:four helix bundle protein
MDRGAARGCRKGSAASPDSGMSGVKELKLWQEAVVLAADVTRAVKGWAREHRAAGEAAVERAATVACAVAAGYAAGSTTSQLAEYRAAERALGDLDTRLAIARQAGLLSAAAAAQLSARSVGVGRLLTGYVGYVERQLAAGAPAAG